MQIAVVSCALWLPLHVRARAPPRLPPILSAPPLVAEDFTPGCFGRFGRLKETPASGQQGTCEIRRVPGTVEGRSDLG